MAYQGCQARVSGAGWQGVNAIYLDFGAFASNVVIADKLPNATGGVGIFCWSHAVQSPRLRRTRGP